MTTMTNPNETLAKLRDYSQLFQQASQPPKQSDIAAMIEQFGTLDTHLAEGGQPPEAWAASFTSQLRAGEYDVLQGHRAIVVDDSPQHGKVRVEST